MANPPNYGDPTVVPNLVAQHIVKTATGITVTQQDLSAAISEVTVETQTLGAALLQVTLIDPTWKIARSGLCDVDASGLLQRVDVNFPEGTTVWWRLAMVDFGNDLTQPNLVLTFQQRIINYLMNDWGPLGWPGGKVGQTRAQFFKMLADRIPKAVDPRILGPGSSPLTFICPSINEIQPVASSNIFGTQVVTAQSAAAQKAGVNKLPGVTAATNVTVRGQKPSSAQIQVINNLLGVGQSLGAPVLALEAAIFDVIYESDAGLNLGPNSGGYGGILGGATSVFGDVHSSATAMANSFFKGGNGFQAGGAIAASKRSSDLAVVGSQVTAAVPFDSQGISTQYESQGFPIASARAEATAIVNAFTGGKLLSAAGGVSATPQSDIAQLTRGTSDNPDEDSWTCMQRLAGEVNWSIFSSPQPHPGQWGNFLYFIDGPDMAAQRPSLYISLSDDGTVWSAKDPTTGKTLTGASDGLLTSLSGTVDNTAFAFEQTKEVKASSGKGSKGKVQRQTRIRTPQTPSQIRFNLLAGVMEFNAGDVFVFQNAGPANGRQIVEDVTHNTLADLFAQFTLGPPTFPYPEPQANSVTALGPNVALPGQGPNGATPAAVDVSGYTNPLREIKGLTPMRIDMGVDYGGTGPLLAIGNATVTYAANTGSGWPGGGAVVYKLADGPFKGKFIYYAENISVSVTAGQSIKAGDQIATLRAGYPYCEIGWASGQADGTLASQNGHQATGGDPGGWSSIEGRNFNEFITALGASGGVLTPNPPRQSMPAGWPTLGSTPRTTKPPVSNVPIPDGRIPQQDLTGEIGGKLIQLGGIFGSIFGRG